MKHSGKSIFVSTSILLSVLCGSLIIGCNNDDEYETALRYSLADEQMTRAGENTSQPTNPSPKDDEIDSTTVYLAIDTTVVCTVCSGVDVNIKFSCNEGLAKDLNPNVSASYVQYGNDFGSISLK